MTNAKDKNEPALTESGRKRRRFLERTALTAGSAAAAGAMLPAFSVAKPRVAAEAAPASCPDTKAPMQDVEGKVVFITGGDSGIGLGIARACANAGMKVVITYRSKDHLDEAMKALESAADRIHAIGVDVTDRTAMANAAEETVKVFGKVHVLINNAGVGIIVPLSAATFDDWDWGMSVNVNAVFNGIHAFLPRIKAQDEGGQIVTTSSMSGLVIGATAGIYSTTKFAVVGMMEALRAELANTNIGASVFCPGVVNTNIRDSNRNRPASLGDTAFKPYPKRLAAMQEAARNNKGAPPGMDPLECGERVLRGIRNNDLYILTHAEYEQGIRDRNEALLASIPIETEPAPEARLAAEKVVLRSSVYINERNRKLCERARPKKA
ncbi:MAG: short-chain dehydrogenase/reductase [Gammaproteobacteria bacterium]|nr:short-chain dehydrogenase/reductase [Gammaproteobacteria bacterium]